MVFHSVNFHWQVGTYMDTECQKRTLFEIWNFLNRRTRVIAMNWNHVKWLILSFWGKIVSKTSIFMKLEVCNFHTQNQRVTFPHFSWFWSGRILAPDKAKNSYRIHMKAPWNAHSLLSNVLSLLFNFYPVEFILLALFQKEYVFDTLQGRHWVFGLWHKKLFFLAMFKNEITTFKKKFFLATNFFVPIFFSKNFQKNVHKIWLGPVFFMNFFFQPTSFF